MKRGSARLEVARASTLNTKLALGQIAVFELSARHSGTLVATPNFSFTMKLDSPHCAVRAPDVAAVFRLVVTVEHAEQDSRVALGEVRVAVRAIYRKSADFSAADEAAVPDYIGIVGWMHVWPYLRAEVQSLSTKLDFPPLLLPVLLSGQTADIPVNLVAPSLAQGARASREAKVTATKGKSKSRARAKR